MDISRVDLTSKLVVKISCIMLSLVAAMPVHAGNIENDMQSLLQRFHDECSRLFTSGPDVLIEFTGEMPGSFLLSSSDKSAAYFVWLKEDYSAGTTVLVNQGQQGIDVHCAVNFGTTGNFDLEKAAQALRASTLDGRELLFAGGPMELVSGSKSGLTQTYGPEPLRHLVIDGIFDDPDIVSSAQMGFPGNVVLEAQGVWDADGAQ